MTANELSRPVKVKALPQEPVTISATAEECSALAKRFGLPKIEQLQAELTLTPDGAAVDAAGNLSARWHQNCVVSGEEFPLSLEEKLHFRFVQDDRDFAPDEEIELSEDECDEIDFDGESFDLGEAVAQSFGLALDPYATGPNADQVRKDKGITLEGEEAGPMAEMLAALKKN